MRPLWSVFMCILLAVLAAPALAQETQRQYLSGKGPDEAINWQFMCSAEPHANAWSTIKVPSNWELQDFGIFTYGQEKLNPWPKVQGQYKTNFTVPAAWSNQRVFLVFEGVMTDCAAKVNGQSAGPQHQGGYYQFRYDISKLAKFGADNLLEATVDDESANRSVNAAERRADYWNYAGIYRPVYLESLPRLAMDHVAIDARADGSLAADVTVGGDLPTVETVTVPASVTAQVLNQDGSAASGVASQSFALSGGHVRVALAAQGVRQWTAETPNLYQLELILKDTGGAVVHRLRQRFGFRTIELRPGDGVYVNGSKIMMRGVDRHSFWPDSGRCTSEQMSRNDITLMRQMNMNAVRMSHYPPDQHFLDACDEMGLYVLDELAGWHAKYDTEIGHTLTEAMVKRDVNHPCILFWDNGNEGGWNNDLNDDFAKYDPQARKVLHPWELFRDIDTKHYPNYNLLVQKCAGPNVFFPTEMLHGLYDGGAGAGLADYWDVMVKSKVCAGGFIWTYCDEDVKRPDQNGKLDSHGNMAPDGILGPYREKEASFYTVKQVWSPIVISRVRDTSEFTLENRYNFTNADQCTYSWQWLLFNLPNQPAGNLTQLRGVAKPDGKIPPGQSGKLLLEMMDMGKTPPHDAIAITAKDPGGRELWTWTFPEKTIDRVATLMSVSNGGQVIATDTADALTATAGDFSFRFDKVTGLLASATRGGKTFSLTNGPRFVIGVPATTQPAGQRPPQEPMRIAGHSLDKDDLVINVAQGTTANVVYRIHPNGWMDIQYDYELALTGPVDYHGIAFDYPEGNVKSMRYTGQGPNRVYKNRLAGNILGNWQKQYNNTVTGDPQDMPLAAAAPGGPLQFDYPEFKGYYAGVQWMQLETTEGPITMVVNAPDAYVQVLVPKQPAKEFIGSTGVAYPAAGLSVLHAIPPIGTKFGKADGMGPTGQPNRANGKYRGQFSLYFGEMK